MQELCKNHKLVLAEDGRCVLCRRPDAPATVPESAINRLVTFALLMCLLGAAIQLAIVVRETPAHASLEQGMTDNDAQGEAQDDDRSASANANDTSTDDDTSLNDDASTRESTTTSHKKTITFARADGVAQIGNGVGVTMYSAPWCFICDQARDFLLARGVALTEIDIERDAANMRRLGKRNPSMTIPTFEIEGRTHVGWNRWQVEELLQQAAQQQQHYAVSTDFTRQR